MMSHERMGHEASYVAPARQQAWYVATWNWNVFGSGTVWDRIPTWPEAGDNEETARSGAEQSAQSEYKNTVSPAATEAQQ